MCALNALPFLFVVSASKSMCIGFNPPLKVVWKRIKRDCIDIRDSRKVTPTMRSHWLGLWRVFCCNFQFCSCNDVGEEVFFWRPRSVVLHVKPPLYRDCFVVLLVSTYKCCAWCYTINKSLRTAF